jgi:hypothetical protein
MAQRCIGVFGCVGVLDCSDHIYFPVQTLCVPMVVPRQHPCSVVRYFLDIHIPVCYLSHVVIVIQSTDHHHHQFHKSTITMTDLRTEGEGSFPGGY